jgi:hypothetical protein
MFCLNKAEIWLLFMIFKRGQSGLFGASLKNAAQLVALFSFTFPIPSSFSLCEALRPATADVFNSGDGLWMNNF